MHIRTLQEKDIAATEEICLKTAPASAVQSEKDKLYTLYMYNRYYTRAQKGACFVAADDKDRAVGYILCAPDYKKYLADAENLDNVYFFGRLGDYKYYNMDLAVDRALKLMKNILK